MREELERVGFQLVAGEFPGGSDHDLYPLNVIDPAVARDDSPDPRRHSAGELIPDIVALLGRFLVLGEAKVDYNEPDRRKLEELIGNRCEHLKMALAKFSRERRFPQLCPIETLVFLPTLIFTDRRILPAVSPGLSCIVLQADGAPAFLGPIAKVLGK